MFNLASVRGDVEVGAAMAFGGVAAFPLFRKSMAGSRRDYLTLAEALDRRDATVSEVSEAGSVPEVKLKNLSDQDIFAADGEALRGLKQNRILNASIYVGAWSEVVVPVSCVERGRWRHHRDPVSLRPEYSEFIPSRAAKLKTVAAALSRGLGDRRADQGKIWDSVSEKGRAFEAYSPTESMSDFYDAKRPTLDQYVRNLPPKREQVGLCCAISGRITGLELFEHADVYRQFHGKLVRAWAAEVVGGELGSTEVPDAARVRRLLNTLFQSQAHEYPAVGTGLELRFDTEGLSGSALVVADRLVHLVLLRDASSTHHRHVA